MELSKECKDFIEKLLVKDPSKRLGTSGDLKDILAHPFLRSMDIEQLQAMSLEAPYKPQLSEDVYDVSNFEQEWTERTTFEDARYSTTKADLIRTRASMFKKL